MVGRVTDIPVANREYEPDVAKSSEVEVRFTPLGAASA